MSFIAIIIISVTIASIVGAILVLKKTARKFNLSKEQLIEIKKRNQAIDKLDKKENEY